MHADPREKQMSQSIDVTGLTPDAVRAVESLVVVLRSQAANTSSPAARSSSSLPPAVVRLLDTEFHAACEADASPEVSLTDVRAGLASIPGDLTADFVAERDDR